MVKYAPFYISRNIIGHCVPSKQKQKQKRNINRSRLKLQTGLTNILSSILVALNLSSSLKAYMVSRDDEFLPQLQQEMFIRHENWKRKRKHHSCFEFPGRGTAPKGQEETLKGNCRYIILANRIKSNNPSVTIILLLSYLSLSEKNDHNHFLWPMSFHCWGFSSCLGMHREMLP